MSHNTLCTDRRQFLQLMGMTAVASTLNSEHRQGARDSGKQPHRNDSRC